jgi:hypothetical protein
MLLARLFCGHRIMHIIIFAIAKMWTGSFDDDSERKKELGTSSSLSPAPSKPQTS